MSLTRQRGIGPYFGMVCGCACSNPTPLNTQSSSNMLEGMKKVFACVPADAAWSTYFEICWPGILAHSGVTSPGTTWDNNILPTSHPYVTTPDAWPCAALDGLECQFVKAGFALGAAEHLLAEPCAEIAGHPSAGTAVSHGVVQAVVLADMHQFVE